MRLRYSLLFMAAALYGGAQEQPASLRIEPSEIHLRGAKASQQMLVLGVFADGMQRDLTGSVRWTNSDPSAIELSPGARITAIKNGEAVLTAEAGGRTASVKVHIQDVEESRAFRFDREIGGVLTLKGCNNPNCHGGVKGRGGFKLSAGALYPKDDYEWIVKGGEYQVLTAEVKGERRPRIDVKEPENSLILRKATTAIPHGGGRRFAVDSPEYKKIVEWVRAGAPYGADSGRENVVKRIEILPRTVALEDGQTHRLLVTAVFADGRTEDFTHQALYVSNDKDVATVKEGGLVTAGRLGETSILIRAAGHAASATVGVIGPRVARYPKLEAANYIDEFVFEKLRRFRVVPSQPSSDAEFLRRVCLDLAGALPPPERIREFAASKDPKKREKLIDLLIGSPEFIDYWTFRFDDLMRVSVTANGTAKWSNLYADWVSESIASNKPYDQMARERIAAEGLTGQSRHYLHYNVISPPAEQMAEEVRVFLGRRLDCAQCHNHPYETWSQDQFWGMAAFFGRLFKLGNGDEYTIFDLPTTEDLGSAEVNGATKLTHPRTKAVLKPVLLDGGEVKLSGRDNPRKLLADYMVRHPYFAETIVNRIWSQFFGRGIVDPVDDFRSTNPPSHPELLDRLAEDFRRHNHDLRYLMRTIVSSKTYQLSGQPNETNRADRTNYSHSMARPLDAEVLLDAIADVTGVPEQFTVGVPDGVKTPVRATAGTRAIALRQPDLFYSRFLELYGRPNRLTLPERSSKANLRQALHMLAGPVYNEKLASPTSRLQRLIREGKTNPEIVEEFYLAAFGRAPDALEAAAIEKAIGSTADRGEALKDFVWALLCSREFAENH